MAHSYNRVASRASLIFRIASHEINTIEIFQESLLFAESEAKKRLTKITKGEDVESLLERLGNSI